MSISINIGSNSYVKVKTFKQTGSLLTNQFSNHKEIKCRPKAEICVINLFKLLKLIDCFLRIWKFKICETIILFILQHGCEIRSLMLKEEHSLKVFEKNFGLYWYENREWIIFNNEEFVSFLHPFLVILKFKNSRCLNKHINWFFFLDFCKILINYLWIKFSDFPSFFAIYFYR